MLGIETLKSPGGVAPSLSELVWLDMLESERNLAFESASSSSLIPQKRALSSPSQEPALKMIHTVQKDLLVGVEPHLQQSNSRYIISQASHVDNEFTPTSTQAMDHDPVKNSATYSDHKGSLVRQSSEPVVVIVAEHGEEHKNSIAGISAGNLQKDGSGASRGSSADFEQERFEDTRDILNDNAYSNSTAESSPRSSADDNFYDARDSFSAANTTPNVLNPGPLAKAAAATSDTQAKKLGGINHDRNIAVQPETWPNVSEDAPSKVSQGEQPEAIDKSLEASKIVQSKRQPESQLDVNKAKESDDLHQQVLDISSALEIFTQDRRQSISKRLAIKENSKSTNANVTQDFVVSLSEQSEEIDELAPNSVDIADEIIDFHPGESGQAEELEQVEEIDYLYELDQEDKSEQVDELDQLFDLDQEDESDQVDELEEDESDQVDESDLVDELDESDQVDELDESDQVDELDKTDESGDANELLEIDECNGRNSMDQVEGFYDLGDMDQVDEFDDLIVDNLVDSLNEPDKADKEGHEPTDNTQEVFNTDTVVPMDANDPIDFTWDSEDKVMMEDSPIQSFEDDDIQVEEEDIQTQETATLPLDDVPLRFLDSYDIPRALPCLDLGFIAAANEIYVWWYDAYDIKQQGVVLLFGKYFDEKQECYISCCVRVKNVSRELYILPREFKVDDEGNPTTEAVELQDVQQELRIVLEHKNITAYKITVCDKKYAFNTKQVPKEATYMKLNYGYDDYEFPTSSSGKTFSRIFGANAAPLEHFLVDSKIMGPCWLKLKRPYPLGSDLSWCSLNLGVDNPGDCSVVADKQTIPPLNILSLSLQTKMSRLSQTNEILAASFIVYKNANIDSLDHTEGLNGKRCTIIRPPVGVPYPQDALDVMNKEGPGSKHNICLESSEFGLLSLLLGHNFFGGDLNVLLTRLKKLSVPHWHKLGRIKSKSAPRIFGNSDRSVSSIFYQRLHMSGRIVCDTFEASQDLIKSKSYHLSEIAKTQLDVIRQDIKPQQLDSYYETGASILCLAKHCSLDAYLTFALMAKLQILPLSKQLTNLAGNLWSHSIYGARSERNEYLLLHTFHKKGFICPDKPAAQKKRSFEFADESLELELPAAKRSGNADGKDASFEGGLVLDPKTGIYDKYVLLLDFNSLYPSIMQEYNVCFTTMDLDGDQEPEAPPSQDAMGVLPELVKMFVDRRKKVKRMMSNPGLSKEAKAQYHIEQMGLKLTANSMYGCLGSSCSRFFAKPLAAFITGKGRDILRKTVDMAEQSNLDVIYGDTDSIMINTNQTVFSKANKMGLDLKNKVNLRYKRLELDIDGIFRRTLLLRKKKYAAKVVRKQANGSYKEELEIKGIEVVRRDGCDLARSTSEHVLQLILANDPQEAIVDNIHAYIKTVALRVYTSQVPINDYIIRKQLTKSPEEYRTTKGNPHVIVAKDMRRSGIAVKAGDVIPYINCKKMTPDGHVRESRMPDDVRSGKAVIDKEWYLMRQVLPFVDRLCMPLDGTDRVKLAKCLEIAVPEALSGAGDDKLQADQIPVELPDRVQENDRHNCESLRFKCPSCNYAMTFSKSDDNAHGLTCLCGESIGSAMVYCQTLSTANKYIQKYYDSPYQCTEPSCGFQTRDQLPIDNESCLQLGCLGRLVRQYSARDLYDQLSLLSETIKCISQHQQEEFTASSDMLEKLLKSSAFRYIDFGIYGL
ncbi:hypothetical protein [Parasitella parasitica]|uniref:DNA polymerase n=1 Tax=Parasitella parasitica TaxID=35722 RepID=A0A0B7MSV0_9FUNG|nr:hypothetical protein [Parasitella parasitica]